MTENIIALARPGSCPVYGIDPSTETRPDYHNYILIKKHSHQGLHDIPACDVYFVDGDHNYYTVKRELDHIRDIPSSDPVFPLLFLHDVGWPQDRRDAYYLPSHVPEDYRRKWDPGLGVDPTTSELSQFGIAAASPDYVFADERGGPENGVLTAVEDFVRENPDWDHVTVPGIFGLGIVYKRNTSTNLDKNISEIKTAASWLGEEISILEYNRLQLLCESYRTHHHFSLTTNELSDLVSRNTGLEQEVVQAYHARDAADLKIEELRSTSEELRSMSENLRTTSSELEIKAAEACQARDSANARVEELLSRTTALELEISKSNQEAREAHGLVEEANTKIETLNTHCKAITRSWSFRIGRMITSPIRRINLLLK